MGGLLPTLSRVSLSRPTGQGQSGDQSLGGKRPSRETNNRETGHVLLWLVGLERLCPFTIADHRGKGVELVGYRSVTKY